MQDFFDFCKYGIFIVVLFVVLLAIILTPLIYLDGSAKSEFLRKHKGIDVPWYRSAFLPDAVFMKADITLREEGDNE